MAESPRRRRRVVKPPTRRPSAARGKPAYVGGPPQADEAARRQTARSSFLAEFSAELAEAGTDLRTTLDLIVHRVGRLLDDYCSIRLVSEDGRWLQLLAVHDRDSELERLVRETMVDVEVRGEGQPMIETTMQRGESLCVPHLDLESFLELFQDEQRALLRRLAPHSMVSVPLRVRGRTIGTLSLMRYVPGRPPYGPDDLSLLEELAHRAALAIANVHLLQHLEDRVKQRTAELQSANDALHKEVRQRQLAEAQILRAQHDLREFIDHMSTMNAKVAPDGTLLLLNRIAAAGTGLSPDELKQTKFLDGHWWTYDPQVRARVAEGFRRCLAGEQVSYEENVHVFEQTVPISFGMTPVLDDSGRVSYVVAEGRDISAQKHAEAALHQRTAELETANKELEAFTYSVSHDLRAPLRAIEGFSRILADEHAEHLNPDALKLMERIRANTRQMERLIGDLLSFSRLGRHAVARDRIDTAKLVEGVLVDLRSETAGRRVEFEVGALPACYADAALLKQVYLNLLSNALKYTRTREVARIEIGSYPYEEAPVFFVRDNGVGFDMQFANRLFGVFQRLHRAEEFEGTGVGLAIVQRIVYRHGGRVWAESSPDQGATFSFTLGEQGATS